MTLFNASLALSVLLNAAFVCYSQGFYPPGISPQAIQAERGKRLNRLKRVNPGFAEMEARVTRLQDRVQWVVAAYYKDRSPQGGEEAAAREVREKIRPLIREIETIKSRTDYRVEERIEMLLAAPKKITQ